MRLRYQLLILSLFSVLPLLLAFPWALRQIRHAFEEEQAQRLQTALRAAKNGLEELREKVERTVHDLALDPGEDIGRTIWEQDQAALLPKGEKWMALLSFEVFEVLDFEGRVLTCGHLPARASDLDPEIFRQGKESPGQARVRAIEVRTEKGIETIMAMVAVRPVDHKNSRVYVAGGSRIGDSWSHRMSELIGAQVSVSSAVGDAAKVDGRGNSGFNFLSFDIEEGGHRLGEVVVGMGDSALRAKEEWIMRSVFLIGGICLLASAVIGLILSAKITRPVGALVQAAHSLSQGDLGRQIQVQAGGEVRSLVDAFNGMSRDLKEMAHRAVVAERVAAWREIARRLAHEIKNPLTPIRMSVETLIAAHRAGRADFEEILSESTGAVIEEVERLRRTVDEFSQFARLPLPKFTLWDPGELVTSLLALYGGVSSGWKIEKLEPNLIVLADRDQISQVLLNLLTNAEQAMIPGSNSMPSMSAEGLSGERIGGAITVRVMMALSGREVAFEVQDEGPGVAPEDRERIFEPYFTTKQNGTGLGLAIALRIAQEHGGRLEEMGHASRSGACFRLTLPLANV